MDNVTALFWDVGGVLLSNAWDRTSRRKAAEKFALDLEEFVERHDLVVTAFETGQMDLEEYLDRTVFYRPRAFTRQDFKEFIFSQSEPCPENLALLERLAQSKKYLLATLNNESRDLNLYRIERFGLRKYFAVFFSSCFLGVKKPDETIYRLALDLSQRAPEVCLFIDDRPLNLECARNCSGMRTVLYQNSKQLRSDLQTLGVQV